MPEDKKSGDKEVQRPMSEDEIERKIVDGLKAVQRIQEETHDSVLAAVKAGLGLEQAPPPEENED